MSGKEEQAAGLLQEVEALLAEEGLRSSPQTLEVAAEALGKATSAAKLYKDLGNQPGLAQATRQVAKAKLLTGKPKAATDALAALQGALDGVAVKKDPQLEGILFMAMAEVYAFREDWKEALAQGAKAQQGFRRSEAKAWEVKLLCRVMVDVHLKKEDYEQALVVANEAKRIASQQDDNTIKAEAMLAVMQARLWQDPSTTSVDSMAAATEALQMYRQIGDKKGEAVALAGVGRAHLYNKDFTRAMTTAKEAAQKSREAKDGPGFVDAVNLTAEIHMTQEEPENAEQVVQTQLAFLREKEDTRGQASLMHTLVFAQLAAGNEYKALINAERGLDLARRVDMKRDQARMLDTMVDVHLQQGQLQKALVEVQEAIGHYQDLGDKRAENNALRYLTEIRCQQGLPEKAPHRDEALEELAKLTDAVKERNAELFKEALHNLANIALTAPIIHDHEYAQFLGPVVAKDPEDAMAFLKQHGEGLFEDEEKSEKPKEVKFAYAVKENFYWNFRIGGINYGPKFRLVESSYARCGPHRGGGESGQDPIVMAVLDNCSTSEEWELALRNAPSVLDCGLQSVSTQAFAKY